MRKFPKRLTGFILKDYLLSLLIMMCLLPIIVSALRVSSNYHIKDYCVQDELSIMQLRERLIIAKDITIDGNQVTYRIGEDEYNLKYKNQSLYLTPGYQLFLEELDECLFRIEGTELLLEYVKKGQRYQWVLAKV